MPTTHDGVGLVKGVCVSHFGPFTLDTNARQLSKNGTRIRLQGQPYLILEVLLARAGEVVSRHEIREKLWPADTFVDFEHGLNTSVKKLRQALCDSADEPRYIETIPRLGYRFIAPVQRADAPTSDAKAEAYEVRPTIPTNGAAPTRSRFRRWWIAVAASVAAGAILALSFAVIPIFILPWLAHSHDRLKAEETPKQFTSVAVLPLENLSNDPSQEYFADGMTDELVTDLAQLGSLRVISRTSVMQYKNSNKTVPQIGRELGVDALIAGTVERIGNRVRIRVQLIDTADDRHLWASSYDQELKDVLLLQSTVASDIVREIQGQVAEPQVNPPPADKREIANSPLSMEEYEAYDLYLKGRYFWNKRTPAGFQQAADYFQQSLKKQPHYARAYAGLADTYALMSNYGMVPHNEFMPKARAAAVRALELDEKLAEAHASLANIAEDYYFDWPTAEKEFQRAIQLNPNYATAHHWYAECLSFQGRFDQSLAESKRALELDPMALIIAADHGVMLYYSRQYDRAIEQFRAVLAVEPSFVRANYIVLAYAQKGQFSDALAQIEDSRRFDSTPLTWAYEAYVYGRSGQQEMAQRALEKMEQVNQSQHWDPLPMRALAYTGMNNKDEALSTLERAYVERSNFVTTLKVDPVYDPLRSDPRFQDLLRRIGLAN